VTLKMSLLRGRTPGMVRKEIWAHALAYNLIRTVMAQAAAGEVVPPRSISFKAALQVLEAFRPLIDYQAHRRADFRRGTRLGRDDHLVRWEKPTSIRSVDRPTYNALPDSITVRETRFRVEQPGFRTRSVVVVTTLLDPGQASREDLASLYRARWNNELDLRSIKVTLQMSMLRGQTPGMVRKEIWTHALAYNLVRTVMAQAAAGEGVPPREISFKATLQVLEAFRPLIDYQAHRGGSRRAALYGQVLRAVAVHRVADLGQHAIHHLVPVLERELLCPAKRAHVGREGGMVLRQVGKVAVRQ